MIIGSTVLCCPPLEHKHMENHETPGLELELVSQAIVGQALSHECSQIAPLIGCLVSTLWLHATHAHALHRTSLCDISVQFAGSALSATQHACLANTRAIFLSALLKKDVVRSEELCSAEQLNGYQQSPNIE
jgi:hypothetical protein